MKLDRTRPSSNSIHPHTSSSIRAGYSHTTRSAR